MLSRWLGLGLGCGAAAFAACSSTSNNVTEPGGDAGSSSSTGGASAGGSGGVQQATGGLGGGSATGGSSGGGDDGQAGSGGGGEPTGEDACDDGLDNDGDDKIDCQDEDCVGRTCRFGTDVVLTPSLDSRINAAAPTTSYDKATTLTLDSSTNAQHVLMAFDAVPVSSSFIIRDATLRLYWFSRDDDGVQTIYVTPVAASWSGLVTWQSRPAYSTDPADSVASHTGGQGASGAWIGFDIKPLVNDWLNGSGDNGLALFMVKQSANADEWYFRSSTYADVSFRPQLDIQYDTLCSAELQCPSL